MASNVFISFRYADGHAYKEDLARRFDLHSDTIDCSESVNRSLMTEQTIKAYLYKKLKRSSITIILITPQAINHRKNIFGYDDWMYDEIRYSLEDRENNRPNGLIAVYTKAAETYLFDRTFGGNYVVKDIDNLFRSNMKNVLPAYKRNRNPGEYDRDYDSYCSLISYDEFIRNMSYYIQIALEKREERYKYKLVCRLPRN